MRMKMLQYESSIIRVVLRISREHGEACMHARGSSRVLLLLLLCSRQGDDGRTDARRIRLKMRAQTLQLRKI